MSETLNNFGAEITTRRVYLACGANVLWRQSGRLGDVRRVRCKSILHKFGAVTLRSVAPSVFRIKYTAQSIQRSFLTRWLIDLRAANMMSGVNGPRIFERYMYFLGKYAFRFCPPVLLAMR